MARTEYRDPEGEKAYQEIQDQSSKPTASLQDMVQRGRTMQEYDRDQATRDYYKKNGPR